MRRIPLLVLFLVACAGAPEAPPTAPTQPTPAPPAPAPAPEPAPTTAAAPAPSTPRVPKSDAELPKRISARHVLIQWIGRDNAPSSVVRSQEQALALAQEVLRRARAKEDFARLAVEYSDEPNAGARGGSVGRFHRGQMVPAFEAVAFRLEVGQISDIVESPFGYHIIQRTE